MITKDLSNKLYKTISIFYSIIGILFHWYLKMKTKDLSYELDTTTSRFIKQMIH